MNTVPRDIGGEKPLRVRRGRVDSVEIYEIKDTELAQLERGTPADLSLNFGIALLSIAFSGICTLATATFASATVRTVFIVVVVVCIVIGAYMFLSWWPNRSTLGKLCATIRGRIPPDAPSLAENPPGTAGTGEPPTEPVG